MPVSPDIVVGVTVRAKICGIRSETDLRLAVAAGADAVGFISGITHFSEDGLSAPQAATLSAMVPPFVTRVLVTHLEDASAIVALADEIGVDAIQVHGLVSSATVSQVRATAGGRKILAAVHVTGRDAVAIAQETAQFCDAVLLDSRTEDRLGGTGLTHDWSISAEIVEALAEIGCPVVLAGGLNAGNVGAAIAAVRPFGVDVNSGVEDASGNKSPQACRDFVTAAHDLRASNTARVHGQPGDSRSGGDGP
ncbi:phosphoribosylanthranilate isomerase [Nocardia sp. NPDC005366]|uniref:phosphoribosylanthranilate isomerase n=1 Tax=Nocardia sp. NPDC005366 TaxID=3156878 RepID=UPI0033BD06E7